MISKFSFYSLVILTIFLSGCASSFRSAEKAFEAGHYYEVSKILEKMFEEKPEIVNSGRANFLIAESYRRSNQINKSVSYYQKAIEKKYPQNHLTFYFGYALKANERYHEAIQMFKNYLNQSDTEYKYRKRAETEIKHLGSIEDILKVNNYVNIEPMEKINTSGPEFSPTISKKRLIYTSSGGGDLTYRATGKGFTNIYSYDLSTEKIKAMDKVINLDGYHEASATLSPNGRLMVFARNAAVAEEGKEVDLFITRFTRGKWTKPIRVPISNSKHWDACPAFAPNGKSLYFASNRIGGYGGVDIYKVNISKRGKLGKVHNLGKDINTEGDDMFPYVSPEGRLYFASDGHPGLGGLDLFEVHTKDDSTIIKNMGKPFNSYADDFGICFQHLREGYFTSNRVTERSKGDDDIYHFIDKTPRKKIINYYLTGKTYVNITQADKTIAKIVPNAKVSLMTTDKKVLEDIKSNSSGYFEFKIPLEIGETYLVKGQKRPLIPHEKEFSTLGLAVNIDTLKMDTTNIRFKTNLYLAKDLFENKTIGESIDLLILYDYDKADIREDAALILDRLVENLMARPGLQVELGSHTDARGTKRYNYKLSQRRAKSAVAYIVEKGITPSRIKAKGYGKDELLILDAQNEENHQRNRRTTIKILGQNGN